MPFVVGDLGCAIYTKPTRPICSDFRMQHMLIHMHPDTVVPIATPCFLFADDALPFPCAFCHFDPRFNTERFQFQFFGRLDDDITTVIPRKFQSAPEFCLDPLRFPREFAIVSVTGNVFHDIAGPLVKEPNSDGVFIDFCINSRRTEQREDRYCDEKTLETIDRFCICRVHSHIPLCCDILSENECQVKHLVARSEIKMLTRDNASHIISHVLLDALDARTVIWNTQGGLHGNRTN